jgi:hypothetical protein
VSQALLKAARSGGPAPVRELARRACVGFDAARFKASALVRSGALVQLSVSRPMVLGLPEPAQHEDTLVMLSRSFWECAPATAAGDDAMT